MTNKIDIVRLQINPARNHPPPNVVVVVVKVLVVVKECPGPALHYLHPAVTNSIHFFFKIDKTIKNE